MKRSTYRSIKRLLLTVLPMSPEDREQILSELAKSDSRLVGEVRDLLAYAGDHVEDSDPPPGSNTVENRS